MLDYITYTDERKPNANTSSGSTPSSTSGHRAPPRRSTALLLLSSRRAVVRSSDPEADDAPVIDYVDSNTSSFSAELPDVGA